MARHRYKRAINVFFQLISTAAIQPKSSQHDGIYNPDYLSHMT